MVPSALRIPALALLAAVAALLALAAALRPAADPASAGTPPAQPAQRLSATATATAAPRPAAAPAEKPAPLVAPQRLQAREGSTPGAEPAAAAPRPDRKPRAATAYTVARVRSGQTINLRSKPGGPTVGKLSSRTEFGSKRVLAVAERRGRWLGVLTPERPNGKLGWVDARSDALDRGRTKISMRADLSKRRIDLRVGRKVVASMKVAIGRPGSPTPTGRFAVTDKIAGTKYGPYYGCCILALSGHQPNPPPGWTGGNRLAVHGTNAPGLIGARASAGCLRGSDRDLKILMRRVPVGTPIFISR
jgi:hypothetical protein